MKSSRISYTVRQYLSRKLYQGITWFSPYWNTQLRFWRTSGRLINLRQPKTFSEKLSWLKLYYYKNNLLVKKCADKIHVRQYVQEKGLAHLLIPQIGIYDKPENINWDILPSQFVLKWNFGCGFNLICKNKKELNIPKAVRTLRKWGKTHYWLEYSELQYRVKEKKILCEQFLETEPGQELLDYKFYCFHGKPLAVLVIVRPFNQKKAAVLMTPEWTVLSNIPNRYEHSLIPQKPVCLGEMLQVAELLSAEFPFVRIDLYQYQGHPYFGEMTFTPGACIFPSEAPIQGKPMGEYIDLGQL